MAAPRASLRELATLGLGLGLASGLLEVALRLEPRLGLDLGDRLLWGATSVGLALTWLGLTGLGAWVLRFRSRGLLLAGLLGLHAALWYRYELVVNAFMSEPRVWGAVLGIGAVALVLGLLVDPLLRRYPRPVLALCGLVALGSLGVLVAAPEATGSASPRTTRPNILLISLDTTRPDHLGVYGATNPTPALSRLAAEGVRFTDAVATAPLTEPSHLAMLTGIPPHKSGVVSNGTPLGPQPALLPGELREAGYTTAAFVSAFPLHSRFGWDQAFDVYDDDFGELRGLHQLAIMRAVDQLTLPQRALRERRGTTAVDRALSWLEAHQDEQSFALVHLFDPHAPYVAPGHPFNPPTDGEALALPAYWPPRHRAITSTDWLVEAYEAELRFTDALVGELLEGLDRLGLADQTVVVLTADHGESLTEHGYLFDHGDYLYDASLRIPLLIRLPDGTGAGSTVSCQVSNLDIPQTLLGILDLPDEHDRLGRDLGPFLAGEPCDEQATISTTVAGRFVEVPPVDHALRLDGFKLIRHDPEGERTNELTGDVCFDVVADPREEYPLEGCPPRFAEILDIGLSEALGPLSPEMGAETRSALEALGYIEVEGMP